MSDVRGMRIVVTGTNRGIGQAIASGLTERGAVVGALNRSPNPLAEPPSKICVKEYKADLRHEESVRLALEDFVTEIGGIDCVVCNAAWMPPATPVCDISAELLSEAVETNLYGSFYLTKYAIPHLVKNEMGGRVIYVSSALGASPNAGLFPYSSSKAGVDVLTKVVHKEYNSQGVRTVAIAPGLTDTEGMRASVGDEYIDKISNTYPGGLGAADDIVPYVLFFSDRVSWKMSGSTVYVRPAAAA